MPEELGDEDGGSGWWKPIAVALAALAGAVVVWGWLKPPRDEAPDTDEVDADEGSVVLRPTADLPAGSVAVLVEGDLEPARAAKTPPPWVRPTILWTLGVVVAVGVGLLLLGVLQTVVFYIVLALFFSFALEPAVNYMHARGRGGEARRPALLLGLVMSSDRGPGPHLRPDPVQGRGDDRGSAPRGSAGSSTRGPRTRWGRPVDRFARRAVRTRRRPRSRRRRSRRSRRSSGSRRR